jgi:hypothetical protein
VECESKSDIRNIGIGTISESLRHYMSNIRGKHEITELQKKTAILDTAHILRKVLISKYKTYFTCEITCITNCKYRTAATLYTLETWFCFRYVIVNTLHKGVDDDDDDDNNNNNNNNNC